MRFEASGWHVIEVLNSNDVEEISPAPAIADRTNGMPAVIIAETTKGKSAELIENKASWHHKLPGQEEYEIIAAGIAAYKEALING